MTDVMLMVEAESRLSGVTSSMFRDLDVGEERSMSVSRVEDFVLCRGVKIDLDRGDNVNV